MTDDYLGKTDELRYNSYLRFVGVFLLCLVLSMPLYSSAALAATVSITRNEGSAGIEDFLNGDGDVWSVEATVIGGGEGDEALEASQVRVDLGGTQVPFSSCTGDVASSTCTFQSDVSGGISEGSYPFSVRVYDKSDTFEIGSDSATVYSDESGPTIDFRNIYQEGDDVHLDFTVTDQPQHCVGLDTIEILDAESGLVLQSVSVDAGSCTFNYANEGGSNGILQSQLEGEGLRQFRIRATDLFGHESFSRSKLLDTDFIAPQIELGSLEIPQFGEFIGASAETSDVTVQINECGNVEEVAATSEQINFDKAATLSFEEGCLWTARWSNVQVDPSGNTISAEVVASDEAGNIGSAVVSATFIQDVTAPKVDFFGTEKLYEGVSYVASGEQSTIVLRINEDGSGIDAETGVALNTLAVGGADYDVPDLCVEDQGSDVTCYWYVNSRESGTTSKEMTLRHLEDRVGNSGESEYQTVQVIVDANAPDIKELDVYALSPQGKKDFFASNDNLVLEFTVEEASGLEIYVDASDLVMDAETKYQHGITIDGVYQEHEYDGWARFTEDSCQRAEEELLWECEVTVPGLKSGYAPGVDFELAVFDTAGNTGVCDLEEVDEPSAVSGGDCKYQVDILGLDEETNPDFWEVSISNNVQDENFVDLDVARLTHPRVSYPINLKSDIRAQLVDARALECVSEQDGAPTVSRALLYGGIADNSIGKAKLTLITEFEPFDPSDLQEDNRDGVIPIDYTCSLSLYSVVENTAIQNPETQDLEVSITFAFSEQGSVDENLEELIYQEVASGNFRALVVMDKIADILKWVGNILTIINAIIWLVNTVSTLKGALQAAQSLSVSKPAADAGCISAHASTEGPMKSIQKFLAIFQVFFCKPPNHEFAETGFGNFASGWAQWQKIVLKIWAGLKGEYLWNWAFSGFKGGTFDGGETDLEKVSNDPSYNEDQRGKEFAYNQVVTRGTGGATLYDNIYVASLGLCIPGVLYNVQKIYQAHCTKLACLQNDVPQGLSTVDACFQIQEYLVCKWVLGEVVGQIMTSLLLEDLVVGLIESVIFDPVGTIMLTVTIICGQICNASTAASQACTIINFLFDTVGTVGNVITAIQEIPNANTDICEANGIELDPAKYSFHDAGSGEDDIVTTDDVDSGFDDSTPRGDPDAE